MRLSSIPLFLFYHLNKLFDVENQKKENKRF